MKDLTSELVAICRAFGVFERESVCCGSVSVPQCLVLQQLLEGPQDVSSLAEQAGASISAMTRLLDGLERKGWTKRSRGADDRRRVVTALTSAGRRQAVELRRQTEAMLEAVLARIPKAKQRQVRESMHLIRTAMDQVRQQLRGCCC